MSSKGGGGGGGGGGAAQNTANTTSFATAEQMEDLMNQLMEFNPTVRKIGERS